MTAIPVYAKVRRMSNYEKGARAERELVNFLERIGYECVRSAGSKGAIDVVATHKTHTRYIQVKSDTGISDVEAEQLKLYGYRTPHNASVELWTRLPDLPFDERWKAEVI